MVASGLVMMSEVGGSDDATLVVGYGWCRGGDKDNVKKEAR